nr:MAG TPA: hypothetical protein [Caudoviricetes sp.]
MLALLLHLVQEQQQRQQSARHLRRLCQKYLQSAVQQVIHCKV